MLEKIQLTLCACGYCVVKKMVKNFSVEKNLYMGHYIAIWSAMQPKIHTRKNCNTHFGKKNPGAFLKNWTDFLLYFFTTNSGQISIPP